MPQARLELRLAIHDEGSLVYAAAPLAIRASSSVDELLESIPEGRDGIPVLKVVAGALGVTERLHVLKEIARGAPTDTFTYEQTADLYLTEMSKGNESALCGGDQVRGCEEAVVRSADALHALVPTTSTAARYRASLRAASGKTDQADRLLADRCGMIDDTCPASQPGHS
jgi:hypothetical protein